MKFNSKYDVGDHVYVLNKYNFSVEYGIITELIVEARHFYRRIRYRVMIPSNQTTLHHNGKTYNVFNESIYDEKCLYMSEHSANIVSVNTKLKLKDEPVPIIRQR